MHNPGASLIILLVSVCEGAYSSEGVLRATLKLFVSLKSPFIFIYMVPAPVLANKLHL